MTLQNINDILYFYNKVYKNDNLVNDMRLFAENEFSCESQISKIIDMIKINNVSCK